MKLRKKFTNVFRCFSIVFVLNIFQNDYTWHRHGQLPPVSPLVSSHPFCETVPTATLVDNENKDILSTILMVTHAMITDLYTIQEVLQEVRNRYQFFQ